MLFSQLPSRTIPPLPWAEADNIPWNDPAFSERMLREHLSQAHDAASRRLFIIQKHIDWMSAQAEQALGRPGPYRILDLGCGPGLYTSEFARRGHICEGIDFSPAAIRYARQTAEQARLSCIYQLADLRQAVFGGPFDLITFIYGEFNVFPRTEALHLLQKAQAALCPDGLLIVEPHTYRFLFRRAREAPIWYTAPDGLFSPAPHLVLEENFWDADRHAGTSRYYVVDAGTAQVSTLSASYQAYHREEYRALFAEAGFGKVKFYGGLTGQMGEGGKGLMAIIATNRLTEQRS
jgi:SAM-dependent methyltransferase